MAVEPTASVYLMHQFAHWLFSFFPFYMWLRLALSIHLSIPDVVWLWTSTRQYKSAPVPVTDRKSNLGCGAQWYRGGDQDTGDVQLAECVAGKRILPYFSSLNFDQLLIGHMARSCTTLLHFWEWLKWLLQVRLTTCVPFNSSYGLSKA